MVLFHILSIFSSNADRHSSFFSIMFKSCFYFERFSLLHHRVLKEETSTTGVIVDIDDEFTATAGGGGSGGDWLDTPPPAKSNNKQIDGGLSFSKKVNLKSYYYVFHQIIPWPNNTRCGIREYRYQDSISSEYTKDHLSLDKSILPQPFWWPSGLLP